MWQQLDIPDANIRLNQSFLSQADAGLVFNELRSLISWQQDRVCVFGRSHAIPRLHQWYADSGLDYRWSGLNMSPQPWFDELSSLRDSIVNVVNVPLNSVLVNLYRDGHDSVGWHADDEPEFGQQPVIASLSLGAERDFMLRYRDRKSGISNQKITLASGSLLIMSGHTQEFWQHALPKRKKVTAPRINLTFRQIA